MVIKIDNGNNLGKREVPGIYSEIVEIDAGDVDYTREIKMSAIQKIFQSLATDHVKLMKLSMTDLQEIGYTWVISRMFTKIIRRPRLYDRVLARTWCSKANGKVVERDFEVEDEEGNILIKASSKWCVIDMTTRKPIDIDKTLKYIEPKKYCDKKAFDVNYPDYYGENLEEQKYLEFTRKVRLSDLDLNNHMNNTIYIDMIFDIFTPEEYNKNTFEGMYIKYKKEARLGDEIIIRKYYVKDLIVVKGFVKGVEIFESVIDIFTEEEKRSREIKNI